MCASATNRKIFPRSAPHRKGKDPCRVHKNSSGRLKQVMAAGLSGEELFAPHTAQLKQPQNGLLDEIVGAGRTRGDTSDK